MAALDIPEEYEDGLVTVNSLSDEAFNELASALETAPFALRHRLFAANVAPRAKSLSKSDVSDIIGMLISMNLVRRGAEVNTSEFVDDVYEAATESDNEELITTIFEQGERFTKRLSRLLECKSLEVVSKAQSVILDHERRFCSARIATDVSPVFSSDAEQPPMAAVITHTLRISFHQESNEIKEFFVEMNDGDLRKLSHSIKRAGQKTKGLKAVLDAAKLPYLE
jgi:hypothetical protein